MKIKLIVFDLDGTLVSSHETIYKATLHALKEIHINVKMPEEIFYKRIGLHFEDIFQEFGFKVPDFEHFINIYKSIYFDYIDLSNLYPGVNEIIKSLKQLGKKISLLTTKVQDQAELIIQHFELEKEFDYIMGRRPGIAHKPSPEPLQKICSDLNIQPKNTLVVGDSEMDILCGKNAGAKTCAVTYGYRTREELEKSDPDFLIDEMIELGEIISDKY